MTDESTSNVVPLWAVREAWAHKEATRLRAFILLGGESLTGGVDLKDFLYFLKKCPMRMGAAYALQRKHFSGLGTKNPTVLVQDADGTYTRKMLHVKAAKIIIKYIGREGDPEDRPFPSQYTMPRFFTGTGEERKPRRTAAGSEAEGDEAAA
jgi:hypothetical protein